MTWPPPPPSPLRASASRTCASGWRCTSPARHSSGRARRQRRLDGRDPHAGAAHGPIGSCALKVMIIDDELAGRRVLREYCAAQADLELVGELADGLAALEQIRECTPDLLFLDIQMDTLDGIALARALDPATMPLIVFVTAYHHYALEAFEVSAMDYLLKPFDEERFGRTLERARQRLRTDSAR